METETSVIQFLGVLFVGATNVLLAAILVGLLVQEILIPTALDIARWVRRHHVIFIGLGMLLGTAVVQWVVIVCLGLNGLAALTAVFLVECERRRRRLITAATPAPAHARVVGGR
jgi:uncharacterized membrane protein